MKMRVLQIFESESSSKGRRREERTRERMLLGVFSGGVHRIGIWLRGLFLLVVCEQ